MRELVILQAHLRLVGATTRGADEGAQARMVHFMAFEILFRLEGLSAFAAGVLTRNLDGKMRMLLGAVFAQESPQWECLVALGAWPCLGVVCLVRWNIDGPEENSLNVCLEYSLFVKLLVAMVAFVAAVFI